ncbi:hypothetical protein VPH35_104000 [Triticum aestivum]
MVVRVCSPSHNHPHPWRGESFPAVVDLGPFQRACSVGAASGPTRPGSCAPSGSFSSSTLARLRTPALLVIWLAVHPGASSIPAHLRSCALPSSSLGSRASLLLRSW